MTKSHSCLRLWVTVGAMILMPPLAIAQQDRAITLVVPLAAGSTTDVTARLLAQHTATRLGVNIVVENKPGAGTTAAAGHVAKAAPDGHTLLMGTVAMAVASNLYKNVPYDPVKDFEPISLLVTAPMVLTVNPKLGVKTIGELLAKYKGHELTFSSGGAGTLPHLTGELFKSKTGLSMRHVPYRGGGPAFTDVIAGHVNMMFATPVVKQNIDKGDVHALAASGRRRVDTLPEVPTFAEAGVPMAEIDFGAWFGIMAPAGTPKAIIEKYNAALNAAVQDPEVERKLVELGLGAHGSTPAEFTRQIQDDVVRWPPIFRAAGITAN